MMATNGYIPVGQLVYVGIAADGQPAYLHAGAAADWLAMKAACHAETGVTLLISGDGGGYRSFALQEYYYDQYINHDGANAAYPGTSNHGWGKAVDIWNWARVYSWLLANGHRWGFENNYAPEGWHYQHLSDTAINPIPPAPEPEKEEDDMKPTFAHRKEGADEWMIVHPQLVSDTDPRQVGYLVTTDEAEAKVWARLYANGWSGLITERYPQDLSRADYVKMQDAARRVARAFRTLPWADSPA